MTYIFTNLIYLKVFRSHLNALVQFISCIATVNSLKTFAMHIVWINKTSLQTSLRSNTLLVNLYIFKLSNIQTCKHSSKTIVFTRTQISSKFFSLRNEFLFSQRLPSRGPRDPETYLFLNFIYTPLQALVKEFNKIKKASL